MRSYEAARTYFSVLSFASWCAIVVGGIVALISMSAMNEMSRNFGGPSVVGLAGLLPGLKVAFGGVMGLVLAQIGRAGVDTAECTQQMLQISRDHLDVSKRGLQAAQNPTHSFGGKAADNSDSLGFSKKVHRDQSDARPAAAKGNSDFVHRGRRIRGVENGYHFDGHRFQTLLEAQEYIDTKEGQKARAPHPGANKLLAEETPTFEHEPGDEIEASKVEVSSDPRVAMGLADGFLEYNDKMIEVAGGEFRFSKMTFRSLDSAQRYIDRLGVNPNVQLGGVKRS